MNTESKLKEARCLIDQVLDELYGEDEPVTPDKPELSEDIEVFLVVGHAGDGATGEQAYCKRLAIAVSMSLSAMGVRSFTHHHTIVSYGARQDAMADACRRIAPKAKVCVELHCNAYDGTASGSECLYNASPKLAEDIQANMTHSFPQFADRGVKQRSSGNGSGFLIKAPCASVITESFFIDNREQREYFDTHIKELGQAIAQGIVDY